MKTSSTVIFALGLMSSPVWAQTGNSIADPPAAQTPSSSMPGQAQTSTAAEPDAADMQNGSQSSGASASSASSFGSGGQLITPAIAQSRPSGTSTSVRVQPQTVNNVTYMCGGIGLDESTYMKQTAARDFDVMMTFAARTGNYVADVNVAIRDARGNTVLETTCDGPIMLVDFPAAGNYRVHADAGGHALNKTVQVKAKGRTNTVVFTWPRDAVGVESTAGFEQRRLGETSSGASGMDGARGDQVEMENRRSAMPPNRRGCVTGAGSIDAGGSAGSGKGNNSSGSGNANGAAGTGGNTASPASSSSTGSSDTGTTYDHPGKGIR